MISPRKAIWISQRTGRQGSSEKNRMFGQTMLQVRMWGGQRSDPFASVDACVVEPPWVLAEEKQLRCFKPFIPDSVLYHNEV